MAKLFIVKTADGSEVITGSRISKDLSKQLESDNVKVKDITDYTNGILDTYNGASITLQEYNNLMQEGVSMLRSYTGFNSWAYRELILAHQG